MSRESTCKIYWPSNFVSYCAHGKVYGYHLEDYSFCISHVCITNDTHHAAYKPNGAANEIFLGTIGDDTAEETRDFESSIFLKFSFCTANQRPKLQEFFRLKPISQQLQFDCVQFIYFHPHMPTQYSELARVYEQHQLQQNEAATHSLFLWFIGLLSAAQPLYQLFKKIRGRYWEYLVSCSCIAQHVQYNLQLLLVEWPQKKQKQRTIAEMLCRTVDILLAIILTVFLLWRTDDLLGYVYIQLGSAYSLFSVFLREHVVWIMGWPAGLKLNHALNNLLGNMSLSGLDWWLDVLSLSTIVRHVLQRRVLEFILLGYMCIFGGITFLLALCHDVIGIVFAHLNLFYLVSKKIFILVLQSILSCWRIFRGLLVNGNCVSFIHFLRMLCNTTLSHQARSEIFSEAVLTISILAQNNWCLVLCFSQCWSSCLPR